VVSASAAISSAPVVATATVVTQTRVRPEHTGDFAAWQEHAGRVVSDFGGLIDQQVFPPSPPVQVDWTVVQHFTDLSSARSWLDSPQRAKLVAHAAPWLVGDVDVHVFENASGDTPAIEPVTAVISTRVAPGKEEAFQAWQRKIAVSQAKFPGFQGYKLAPPVPDVQESWVTILRFDSAAHLDAWMTSPIRELLLGEAEEFTEESRIRIARTGFDAWFGTEGGPIAPPAGWKQNMIVLLGLYPVVYLFGETIDTPLLMDDLGLPFWFALFIANIASVLILSKLVPRLSGAFSWWLRPAGPDSARTRTNARGVGLLLVLYLAFMIVFSQFP
jgi:uncharacterized protein